MYGCFRNVMLRLFCSSKKRFSEITPEIFDIPPGCLGTFFGFLICQALKFPCKIAGLRNISLSYCISESFIHNIIIQ